MAIRRRLTINAAAGSGGTATVPAAASSTVLGRLTTFDVRGLAAMKAGANGANVTRGLCQIGDGADMRMRSTVTYEVGADRWRFDVTLGLTIGPRVLSFKVTPVMLRGAIDDDPTPSWRTGLTAETHPPPSDEHRRIMGLWVWVDPERGEPHARCYRGVAGLMTCTGEFPTEPGVIPYFPDHCAWADVGDVLPLQFVSGPQSGTVRLGHTTGGEPPAAGFEFVRDAVGVNGSRLSHLAGFVNYGPVRDGWLPSLRPEDIAAGWNLAAAPLGTGAVPSLVPGGASLALTGAQVVDQTG